MQLVGLGDGRGVSGRSRRAVLRGDIRASRESFDRLRRSGDQPRMRMRVVGASGLLLLLVVAGVACGGRIAPEPLREAPEPPPPDASLPAYDAPACSTTTTCHGVCVDVLRDPQNCGGCDVLCPIGSICSGGTCVAVGVDAGSACAGAVCAGICVNTSLDPRNCGGCGRACDPTQTCFNGDCVCSHGNPCDGRCVDHLNDHENCGFCEFKCAAAQTCVQGHCV